MFATSISSQSRGKSDKAPKSSFAERFGSPAQPQAQDSQTSFPTWPGLQSAQASPNSGNTFSLRSPPPNLTTPGKDTTDESKQTTTRRYRQPSQSRQKPRELFSECIGNASSFANTSSFEAKVAMEPAAHTFNRWMVAAKNNIDRFKSIPEPVVHTFEPPISSVHPEESVNSSTNSTARQDTLESPPKSFARASRSPIVAPSGRRMLSTSTTDSSAGLLLPASPVDCQDGVADTEKSPSRPPLWKLCAVWMLAAASEIRRHPQPVMSGFMRRLCVPRCHSSLSNSSLSFFQPAFHPSLSFVRGYATERKRVFKHRAHSVRDTTRAHRGKQKPASTRKRRRKEQEGLNSQHNPKKSHLIQETSSNIDAPCILIPAPTTQTELCNALRCLIQSTEPPVPLPRLIATHIQYPTLQTPDSYNLLLAHASRVAPIPYSAQIISQLRASGIVWDKSTEQLVVRAHIQSGQWDKAIGLAEKLWLDGPTSRTPLDIFAELLHFVLMKNVTMEEMASMADRCWKLFPTGVSVDVIGRSPRIAYNTVRLLARAGRHEHALQLTTKLLESLESPTLSNIRYCRSILCHVIRPPRGCPDAYSFEGRRRLFESLLQHNPSLGLTPGPELTCALLQNLRRRRKRGSFAFHTLLELRAKYGPEVEDSTVRRMIAQYAIKEENLDLARQMFERERIARLQSSKKPQSTWPESRAPWVGQKALPTQSHLEYLRNQGPDNRKFTVTAKSLRRKEVKLGRKEQTHPRRLLAAEKRAKRWESIHPGRKQHVMRRSVLHRSGGGNQEKNT